MRTPLFIFALVALGSCATTTPAPPLVGEQPSSGAQLAAAARDEQAEPEPAAAPAPVAAATCTDFVRDGVIRRASIERAVDAGLGRWLAGVDVERHLDRGRFRGWRVVRLYPGDPCYAQVDVVPGDVIVSINGRSIERPDAAHEVFQSLRTAPALIVKLLRGGSERTVTFEIAAP